MKTKVGTLIDAELLKEVKRAAAEDGKRLCDLIAEALAGYLAVRAPEPRRAMQAYRRFCNNPIGRNVARAWTICTRSSTTTCWRAEGYRNRRRLAMRAARECSDLRRRRTLEASVRPAGAVCRGRSQRRHRRVPHSSSVCHKLMLIETRARNKISGSNPACKLSDPPEGADNPASTIGPRSTQYSAWVCAPMEQRLADYARAVELPSAYSLLSIGTVILAAALRVHADHLVTTDTGFRGIDEFSVVIIDDLRISRRKSRPAADTRSSRARPRRSRS